MSETAQLPLIDSDAETHTLPPVHLDQFEGPLDMLLHLIRKQKMDVFDIPIAIITQQYMDMLEVQDDLDLEMSGDYLVMASSLMQLKSRMLLPRPEIDDEGNNIDPRSELAAQLVAYEQYRLLAEALNERPLMNRDVFARSIFPEADDVERPLAHADLDALLVAFRQVLKRVNGEVRQQIFTEPMNMRAQMAFVLQRLQHGSMQLDELLHHSPGREALITTILAILELWRQQSITVLQGEHFGAIMLLARSEEA
ncbi:MAG: segregation/condensation protein A [Mariprofundus sp.]|nr:segregation/condensation protein A [Mariprofundus sp.]